MGNVEQDPASTHKARLVPGTAATSRPAGDARGPAGGAQLRAEVAAEPSRGRVAEPDAGHRPGGPRAAALRRRTACPIWGAFSCCSPSLARQPGPRGPGCVASPSRPPAAASAPWSSRGVALVDRSPRGSRLTDIGILVTDWARRIVDTAEAFDAGAQALRARAGCRLLDIPPGLAR